MTYEIPAQYRAGAAPEPLPENALSLEWTGCAGFRIRFGGTVLLIDPFVTRPRVTGAALMLLHCNKKLCAEVFPRADHILVGHSHYDHLMDVPEIARLTGATVYGSPSTACVCLGAGMDESKVRVAESRMPFQCGEIRVTCVPGIHGKVMMGKIPFPGQISGRPKQPMRFSHYRVGGVYGFLIEAGSLRLYHTGSADLIDDELRGIGAVDALLSCIAGRQPQKDYVQRITGLLKPRFIIPHHYDDFFKPLKYGNTLISGVGIDEFYKEARAAAPDARVIVPDHFRPIAFDTDARELLEKE